MMGPGLVPWHVKFEYYFYCHCTNLKNCTKVKMCSYSPKQGNKDSIVFGAEHLLVSHTYSHNYVILGCLYNLNKEKNQRATEKMNITIFTAFYCLLTQIPWVFYDYDCPYFQRVKQSHLLE